MADMVAEFMERFTNLWWECDTIFPALWPTYTNHEQAIRESQMDRFLADLSVQLKRPPNTEAERKHVQEHWIAIASELAKFAFGFEERHIQALHIQTMVDIMIDFARMARRFDPKISAEDIYQAGRNVTTTNLLQLLLGVPAQLTPALFAYSMLYPYTDNYLDDPDLSAEAKLAFNERFRLRLEGEAIRPANAHEQIIFDLVGMVEGQFERAYFPQVYESLLAIHRAQTRSMRLLRRNASPYEVDVLGIGFEKGGTSVLADAYLAAGTLTYAQAEFSFGLGVFLQLGDDLEDVQQDSRDGLQTVFSQTARQWPLDAVTSRTLTFGMRVLSLLESLDSPPALIEFIRRSAIQPFIISAGRARYLHNKGYLRELQSHSPYRYAHLNKQSRWFSRHRAEVTRMVDVFAGGEMAGQ
jgi:hypothetical protein